ncbi:MAG: hypothetical protein HW407_2317 [Bacteroidetes bacterium]|nr:hypothetical protein [Bacteroidota bacterium]
MEPSHRIRIFRKLPRRELLLLLIISLSVYGLVLPRPFPADNAAPPSQSVFLVGEELVYNVRYGFIDLGQVKIVTQEKVSESGSPAYRSEAVIKSYSGVPFVDLHAIYQSVMDSGGFSHRFVGRTKENGSWSFSRYFFDYDHKRVLMEVGSGESDVSRRDTVSLESTYHDGLSLFFYAREKLFSGKKMNIPTFVREENGNTYIDFKMKHEAVETDFIDYPVDVVGFDGTAEFVGVFGLTGDFEGWFSDDEARVPIVAKMKVIIGSVTLELVSWKRPGWEPPRGSEE